MKRTVEDVMTRTVVVAGETTPFKEIARLMAEHRVSALPVLDDAGALVGIVSEADLLLKEGGGTRPARLFEGRRRRVERSKAAASMAADLMTTPVVCATATMTMAEAARLMHERGVKRLPVIDEVDRVVGIVSRRDLLKVFLRADEEIRRDVLRDVLDGLLWIDPGTVTASVAQGVVTLEGRVDRRSTVDVLGGLVAGVDGVVRVVNRVDFDHDDVSVRPDVFTPWGVYAPGSRARR